MNYYVSKGNVAASIEYFKTIGLDSDDMLFLFLLSKHLGITTTSPITYLVSKLSNDEKATILNSLWMLGGLFDSREYCDKKGLMFPTGFSKVSLYQPGTDFQGVLGRIKDTIEKKNHNVPIYNDADSSLTLKNNYSHLIEENYLNGNRISLKHLSSWIFRFVSFEYDSKPTDKQFSRMLEQLTIKFFNITKKDFLWLIDDDLSTEFVSPSENGMTGNEVRNFFDFPDDKIPEVREAILEDNVQKRTIGSDTITKILKLQNGNPSYEDIFDTLLNKKQIVITGVPGVGKTWYTQNLCKDPFFNSTKTIQFHPNYTYDDFIGSDLLVTNEKGTNIETKKGVFFDFALQALDNPQCNFLFVIDELNRGDIAAIFGETILTLDRGYEVELNRSYDNVTKFKLPENLYIVGTMNTSDRNIAFLDLAIRRRFAFVSLSPNYDFLSDEVEFEDYDLGNILKLINQRILNVLKDSELILGQSYFIPPKTDGRYVWTENQFKNQFNFVLLPTLKEYSFNDSSAVQSIIGEELCDSIQDLDEFMKAFKAEFGTKEKH